MLYLTQRITGSSGWGKGAKTMRKLDLNAIYISERVQETLRPVSVSALTAVVAPMGYGKTTAINWFLNQRRQTENAVPSLRFLAWKVLHFCLLPYLCGMGAARGIQGPNRSAFCNCHLTQPVV